jgi:sulfite exporter TauE/SafE/copper chaperone CopZ
MNNIKKIVIKVDGMSCASCELRINNALNKLSGVKKAIVSYKNSRVEIEYDSSLIHLDMITKEIEKIGYKVKKEEIKPQDKFNVNQIIGVGIIIFAVYMIINKTIGFNFIPQIDQSMGYGILFVVGLLTSLHCIAMCGGINLSQCVSANVVSDSKFSKLTPSLLYNTGRVISYTIIGGIVGAIGSVVSFSGTAKGVVAILTGVFMVIMGINMLNIFPWLKRFNVRMPKFFGNKIYNDNGKHTPLYVGLLNGLMPCGPLQAMQLYALGTGSFVAGATAMFFFGIGTVPLMFGFGALSSILSARFTSKMLKISAILVVLLGVMMVNRGLNLSGVNYAKMPVAVSQNSSSIFRIENGVQYVSTTLESGDYYPITVQKGIPVKWTITAKASDLNGCNNPVTIPKYGIQKKLVVGDNLIEFIPEQEGNITYTCWMGMISSNIKVVSDILKVSPDSLQQPDNSNNSSPKVQNGGGCCAVR